jgi:hypothetical protein
MELDELKKQWNKLDEQLKKQQLLNEKLMFSIRQSQSGPFRFLINYLYFEVGLAILAFVAIFSLWINNAKSVYFDVIAVCSILLMVICGCIVLLELNRLKKVDFTATVEQSIRYIENFWIRYKKQQLIAYIVGGIYVAILYIVLILWHGFKPSTMVALTVTIIVAILVGIWEYRKVFKKNVESIMQSLARIKELEENQVESISFADE